MQIMLYFIFICQKKKTPKYIRADEKSTPPVLMETVIESTIDTNYLTVFDNEHSQEWGFLAEGRPAQNSSREEHFLIQLKLLILTILCGLNYLFCFRYKCSETIDRRLLLSIVYWLRIMQWLRTVFKH